MTAPALTEEIIAEAMARAEKIACRPGDHRCYAFPNRLQDAMATCTLKWRRWIDGTRRVTLAAIGRGRANPALRRADHSAGTIDADEADKRAGPGCIAGVDNLGFSTVGLPILCKAAGPTRAYSGVIPTRSGAGSRGQAVLPGRTRIRVVTGPTAPVAATRPTDGAGARAALQRPPTTIGNAAARCALRGTGGRDAALARARTRLPLAPVTPV